MSAITQLTYKSCPRVGTCQKHAFTCLLFFVICLFVCRNAFAQEYEDTGENDYPEDYFYSLIDSGRNADAARALVAERFDYAAAAEIAAYLCSPDPDPACEGTDVLRAWNSFLDQVFFDEISAIDAANNLVENEGFDEEIVGEIEFYWCSPEAGEGCDMGSAVGTDRLFREPTVNEDTGRLFDEPVIKAAPAARGTGPQFKRRRTKSSRIPGR